MLGCNEKLPMTKLYFPRLNKILKKEKKKYGQTTFSIRPEDPCIPFDFDML